VHEYLSYSYNTSQAPLMTTAIFSMNCRQFYLTLDVQAKQFLAVQIFSIMFSSVGGVAALSGGIVASVANVG